MNKELLKKACYHVRVASDIIVTIDIILHGYRLYKEFIHPKLCKKNKKNVGGNVTTEDA